MPHLPNRHQAHPDQRTKMLETPVDKLILTLAAPTIVSMLVTSIYNMADTYFVSQLNTSASGAVGVVFSLMAIIQAVGFTVGMGSGSIASRLLGQERREEADVYASTGVLAALGEPQSYFEAESCAFEGLDKTYTYSGFVITTRPEGEKDYVNSILLTDDSVTTPEGIFIGSSGDDVIAAYGQSPAGFATLLTYTKNGTVLNFVLSEDKVISIEYLAE